MTEYYAPYTSNNCYQTPLHKLPRDQQQMEQITGYNAKGSSWILSMCTRMFSSQKRFNWLWDPPIILFTAYRERVFANCGAARAWSWLILQLVPNYESVALHLHSPISLRSVNKNNFKFIRSVMFKKWERKKEMLKLDYEEERRNKRHFKPTQFR